MSGWTTVVCVASGRSLSRDQVRVATEAAAAGLCRILVVNDNWRLFPQADALYAGDGEWWRNAEWKPPPAWPEAIMSPGLSNIEAARAHFAGEFWTQDKRAAAEFSDLCHVRCHYKPGLCRDPREVHGGQNSGYQAINLAYLAGARRIILIGYDMSGSGHWFGDHPKSLGQAAHPKQWVRHFQALADDLAADGVTVINATIETALTQFPRATLEYALSPMEA